MTQNPLDLQFGPGLHTGFTSVGFATFGDLRPAAVVRELIQNSLDAAVEAGEKTAIIRFRLTHGKTSVIPGIQRYRETFDAAVQSQKDSGGGTLPSQAERVVQAIEEALTLDEHDILSVLDNGIGLDEVRMNALLSDGVSAKGGDATGTFGNGHFVVIPASNLRYILYGGVSDNGHRICSGHAVLASCKVPTEVYQRAGDGFLIHGFQNGSHDYAQGLSIPDPIASELDDIRENSGHGTVVIIPGFNNFRKKASLWDMVAKAAACNFFQAIEEDRLVVWVEDFRRGKPNDPKSLDRSTLKDILGANQNEKRSRSFLSGQKALEAHDVLRSGEAHTVQTSLGELRIQLLVRPSGSARVDLCRNGMWITDDKGIPGFYYKFQDKRPFHALLLLDSSTGGRLHELVRNAEGPLHDKLDTRQRLSPPEAGDLHKALGEIRDWLLAKIPEIDTDSYSPDDFLTLDFGDDSATAGGKARRSFWGTPTPASQSDRRLLPDILIPGPAPGPDPVPAPDPGPGPGPRPEPGPGSRPRTRPALQPFFQVAAIPDGSNRRRIHLETQKSCENAELRLRVDENVDATCDRLRRDETATVYLNSAKVDGREVRGDKLVRDKGRIVGVRLGDISENSSVRIDVEYEVPDSLSVLPGQEPALRVEVFKAPSTIAQET